MRAQLKLTFSNTFFLVGEQKMRSRLPPPHPQHHQHPSPTEARVALSYPAEHQAVSGRPSVRGAADRRKGSTLEILSGLKVESHTNAFVPQPLTAPGDAVPSFPRRFICKLGDGSVIKLRLNE